MKISTRSEYGIRLLLVLARSDGTAPLSLSQIAHVEKLPHDYLEQLVGDLRRAELITASRGQSGGYRLGRAAEDISVADVVRAVEGSLMEMPCAGTATLEACDRPQPCSVHDVYRRYLAGAYRPRDVARGAVHERDARCHRHPLPIRRP